jgi:gluconokinase
MSDPIPALVVMGVSGCGKSTIATALCARTGSAYIEGDDFHPAQNIQKMRAGIPLNDADRQGWLERLAQEATALLATRHHVVIACSALKRRYRDLLRQAIPNLGFVFLALTREEARERVSHRPGHFMPVSLIDSQLSELEPPSDEPRVLTIPATLTVVDIAGIATEWWSSFGDQDKAITPARTDAARAMPKASTSD